MDKCSKCGNEYEDILGIGSCPKCFYGKDLPLNPLPMEKQIIEGNKPRRIQRKRTRGWKMPENTVYVGRPTKWGNPFAVGVNRNTIEQCISDYRKWVSIGLTDAAKKELKGKNLACFCKEGQPCHADVLIEIANS